MADKLGTEKLKSVRFYNEMNLGPSGGTMATVKHHLANPPGKSTFKFDPLLKTLDGKQSESNTINANPMFISYNREYNGWVGPWVMASVNYNAVRRSNAINGYGNKLVYSEHVVFPGLMAGLVNLFTLVMFGTMMFCPPLSWLLSKTKAIPEPGTGPTPEQLAKGFLKVTGFGTGENGTKLKTEMYFPNDTGYVDTARMLVECAMVMIADGDKLTVPGGVYTPGVALKEKLLERLQQTGTTWKISSNGR